MTMMTPSGTATCFKMTPLASSLVCKTLPTIFAFEAIWYMPLTRASILLAVITRLPGTSLSIEYEESQKVGHSVGYYYIYKQNGTPHTTLISFNIRSDFYNSTCYGKIIKYVTIFDFFSKTAGISKIFLFTNFQFLSKTRK